jgi:hypothetical protein
MIDPDADTVSRTAEASPVPTKPRAQRTDLREAVSEVCLSRWELL